MKGSLALLAASCGLVAAHGNLPIPKIMGGRKFLSEMRTRHVSGPSEPREDSAGHVHTEERSTFEKRQRNTDGQCGKGYGNCAAGYCCSLEGYDVTPLSKSPLRVAPNLQSDGAERGQITVQLRTAR